MTFGLTQRKKKNKKAEFRIIKKKGLFSLNSYYDRNSSRIRQKQNVFTIIISSLITAALRYLYVYILET